MINTHHESLLLLDIETVSQSPSFYQLSPTWQSLWCDKTAHYILEGETPETFYHKRAAILAEFGKIICISIGYFSKSKGQLQLRIKSFYHDNEQELLQSFMEAVSQWYMRKRDMSFCGHNIKEFDLPYICRRLLVNGLKIPQYLDFQSRKPWETNIIDTMQFWKFGDFKNYISLNLLSACLGVASPKNDIDGGMVGEIYWKENNLSRIVNYCQRDVVTVGQIILRMKNLSLLVENQVELV